MTSGQDGEPACPAGLPLAALATRGSQEVPHTRPSLEGRLRSARRPQSRLGAQHTVAMQLGSAGQQMPGAVLLACVLTSPLHLG